MILVVTSSRITGLQYHRQIVPFASLGIDVEFTYNESELTDDYLKKFKCISFLREIKSDVSRYKRLGLKVHFDIDDYWVLPKNHSLYDQYKRNGYAENTIQALKDADFVTTTTDYLASRIRDYNHNVYVLANAINTEEEQWQPNPIETTHNRMRFGYVAGVHHIADVEMLYPELMKLYKDETIRGKWQLLTAGYNFNQDAKGDITPNPYYKYIEQCFTGGYHLLNLNYRELLMSNRVLEFKDMDEPYMRLNGMPILEYGKLYDSIDVALVPLISTEFNRNKSQLKLIEAGFKKKAVIVSNVIPYRDDITLKNVLVSADKKWKDNIKYLVKNPNKVEDLKENLFEYVSARYDIKIVNVERKQIFDRWLA